MLNRTDLIGKTITNLVAAPAAANGPMDIWLLQFSDGTHVEFVSPGARRGLRKVAGSSRAHARAGQSAGATSGAAAEGQLVLNVA